MPTLGSRFRAARLHLNISQEKFADLTGYSQYMISKLERGQLMQPRQIAFFAKTLQVTPEFLEYGANPPDWYLHEKEKIYIAKYLVNFYEWSDFLNAVENQSLHDSTHEHRIICPSPPTTTTTIALQITDEPIDVDLNWTIVFIEIKNCAKKGDFIITRHENNLKIKEFSDDDEIIGVVKSHYKHLQVAGRIQRHP